MPRIYCPASLDLQPPFHERSLTPDLIIPDQVQGQVIAAGEAAEIDNHMKDLDSPCQFGSQLPSLLSDSPTENLPPQPQHPRGPMQALQIFTEEDRHDLAERIKSFSSMVPYDFILPSRHGLSRYLAAYVAGFHEHLPFLHITTMTIRNAAPELILAMAAVGAQYCFEALIASRLFKIAKSIAVEQLRRREQQPSANYLGQRTQHENSASCSATSTASITEPLNTNGLHTRSCAPAGTSSNRGSESVLQTAQAVLLLTAIATWGSHNTMFREVQATQ